MNNKIQHYYIFLMSLLFLLLTVPFANADGEVDTSALRDAVTLVDVRVHQAALQAIADANGGVRTAGTNGYDESADYIADAMVAAGYNVIIQEFSYPGIVGTTSNVIAETPGGRDDRVIVVGAHLDSVDQGPGIQDNGSGSAAILEIALQMADLGITPRNKVRFAWWGAEEDGLLGSQFYVNNLSRRDIKEIIMYLNFEMIGSPNFVRFVYDGDGSDTPLAGPNGSANIEDVFLNYFADQGLPVEATAFDGRSSYGPFILAGIPAGGLFSGDVGIKTVEQAGLYGGSAGDQYDPCYHLACDTFANISLEALDQMSDAAAHAILFFAMTKASANSICR